MLKKGSERRVADAPGRVMSDPEAAKRWPLLLAYLTQDKWDDNTPRQPSSLLLFGDGGLIKLMLRDRDAALCCWVACPTLSDGFDAMEAALGDPGTDWRVDRQQPGQAAKRVKRGG